MMLLKALNTLLLNKAVLETHTMMATFGKKVHSQIGAVPLPTIFIRFSLAIPFLTFMIGISHETSQN